MIGTPTLPILLLPYDSLMTEPGRHGSWQFLRRGRCLAISDESQRGKTPGAALTQRWIAASAYPAFKRIASGTPADTPFDFYSQVRWLDPDFWKRNYGIGTAAAFRAHFSRTKFITLNTGKVQEVLDHYTNLDELAHAITLVGSRVEKSVLGLMPPGYARVFHELSRAQVRAYRELRDDAMTILDSGELVTAELAIVLAGRLGRVAAGHLAPTPDATPVHFDPNPREAALYELLRDRPRQTLLWYLWRPDLVPIERAVRRAGARLVVYDGNRPDESINEFRRCGDVVLAGNIHSTMAVSWTLTEADAAVYWSRSDRIIARLQSQDRNHRMGQGRAVTYYDLLAEHTRDVRQLENLRTKRQVTGMVLGDDPESTNEWLQATTAAQARVAPREWLREQLEEAPT